MFAFSSVLSGYLGGAELGGATHSLPREGLRAAEHWPLAFSRQRSTSAVIPKVRLPSASQRPSLRAEAVPGFGTW